MTIDCKGQFRLGNHAYCYPLTTVDGFSRYILACDALASTEQDGTRRVMERVFRSYGLPRRILSDNGSPFAGSGLGHLSRLSVWWVRLGIGIERIVPGNPRQNGSHERMHRTLKAQNTHPPAHDTRGQQKKFDVFVKEFNEERPHESLANGGRPPFTRLRLARSLTDSRESSMTGASETRIVTDNGMIAWKNKLVFAVTRSVGSVWASRRSTMGYGRCTSVACFSPGSTKGRDAFMDDRLLCRCRSRSSVHRG